jgi:hypothetical protein
VASSPSLSDSFVESARAERDKLIGEWRTCVARHEDHARLAEEAAAQAAGYAQTIRELGEMIGAEDQLSIVELSDDLRGEQLRDIAARVLWRHFRAGDIVHYRQWLDLVVAEGHQIGGKNPTATFLTQVARVETVERVRKRSGLYKLLDASDSRRAA